MVNCKQFSNWLELRNAIYKVFIIKRSYVDLSTVKCIENKETGPIKLPEPPTNCCMSGCANCVWIEYAEELIKMFDDGGEKVKEIILNKIEDPNMKAFLLTELSFLKSKSS